MGSRKNKSLHHNLEFQDPYTGGRNVVYHREHRSKKGRRDHHYIQNPKYWERLVQKAEEKAEIEEKTYENLTY